MFHFSLHSFLSGAVGGVAVQMLKAVAVQIVQAMAQEETDRIVNKIEGTTQPNAEAQKPAA